LATALAIGAPSVEARAAPGAKSRRGCLPAATALVLMMAGIVGAVVIK